MAMYRVLIGMHQEKDGVVHFAGGAPFESASDLLRLNGKRGLQPKFELVQDAPTFRDDGLGALNEAALRRIAEDEGIEVPEVANAEMLRKFIRKTPVAR